MYSVLEDSANYSAIIPLIIYIYWWDIPPIFCILADGGVCCIFNGVHRRFMIKLDYKWEFALEKLDFISESFSFGVFNFSRSENFHDNDYLESMANEWTPETGFGSEKLRKHKDGYPKPGIGIEKECDTNLN